MTSPQFPHCERAGLRVLDLSSPSHDPCGYKTWQVVVAHDLEQYLAKLERERREHARVCRGDKRSQVEQSPNVSAEVFTADDFCAHPEMMASARMTADTANRILAERGVRVYGDDSSDGLPWRKKALERHTHTALLVGVTPIAKDTAESLLREVLAAWPLNPHAKSPYWELLERARKVLKLGAE